MSMLRGLLERDFISIANELVMPHAVLATPTQSEHRLKMSVFMLGPGAIVVSKIDKPSQET